LNSTFPAHRAGHYAEFMAKATTISIKNFLKTTIHPRLQDGVFWLVFINAILKIFSRLGIDILLAAPCIIKIEIVLIVDTEKELLGVVR